MLLSALLLGAASRTVAHSSGVIAVRHVRHRPTLMRSDDERRDLLKQLFGEQTTAARVPKAREADLPEVQMLQSGLQQLRWGGIRLVDVDLAAGPLELSLEPLFEDSDCVCVRLDTPLGVLLEEATPASFAPVGPSGDAQMLLQPLAAPPAAPARSSPTPVVVAEVFAQLV